MKYKINDWVEILVGKYKGHIGKIIYLDTTDTIGVIINKKIIWLNWHEIKKCAYIHKNYSIGWFKLSIFKLKNKFSIRFEISKGW